MSRSILVTGGAGFVGSHLVEALLARGDRVRVLDDLSTGRCENLSSCIDDVDLIVGDVRDREIVARAIEGVDGVFHEAAVASVVRSVEDPEETSAVNVLGTVNVLGAAARAGCGALVFASSCAVYGEPAEADLPLGEDAPLKPGSPYAAAKLASEHFCRAFSEGAGPSCVCLRYFNVYGPRQDPSSPYSGVISRFIEAASAGGSCTVFGDGRQTRDFVYVGDVVAANLLALGAALGEEPSEHPGRDFRAGTGEETGSHERVVNIGVGDEPNSRGRVVNIGTGVETSVLGILAGLGEATGRTPVVGKMPAREADIRRSVANAGLARRQLSFVATVPFADGLARTWEWRQGHSSARSGATTDRCLGA